jgi:hypothetical protein
MDEEDAEKRKERRQRSWKQRKRLVVRMTTSHFSRWSSSVSVTTEDGGDVRLVVEDGDEEGVEEREKKGVEDEEDMEAGTSRSTPLRIHRSMSESSYAFSGTDAVCGGWWSVIVCVCR